MFFTTRSGTARIDFLAQSRIRAWHLARNLTPPSGPLVEEARHRAALPDVGPDQIVRVPRRNVLAGLAALFGRGASGAVATGLSGDGAPSLGFRRSPPYLRGENTAEAASAPTEPKRLAA